MKEKIVVFTGAGMSADSGIKTFRASDGLWEEYNIMEVATPQAWHKNPALVLEFYNQRRKQILETLPNAGHDAIAKLEECYDVHVITQNIDNLHERAGSTKVLHLHGEIIKARSSVDDSLIYPIDGWKLSMGELCVKGSQLRPHIVWFGEMVPELERAALLTSQANIFIVIGSSLNVYPAAGLVDYAPVDARRFLIDPVKPKLLNGFEFIAKTAAIGTPELVNQLLQQ